MADVFISYSRKDKEFVQRLDEALKRRDREAWVDWEGIRPTEEFMGAIYGAIEAADTFVFVLTPDSVASVVCEREIAHAAAHNKRMVPLVARDVTAETVPDTLAKLNWIFCRESDDFEKSTDTLITALDTDLAWIHAHTRLLTRAIEWEAKGKNNSFVLRGDDLRDAEQWLSQAGTDKERQPTALQTEYIIASRKAAAKRQLITLGAVSIGLVVAVILSFVAWFARQDAIRQGKMSAARFLTGQAVKAADMEPSRGLRIGSLLAAESLRETWTEAGYTAWHTAASQMPRILGDVRTDAVTISLAFTPDARKLITLCGERHVHVFSAPDLRPLHEVQVDQTAFTLAMNPTGDRVVVYQKGGSAIEILDIESGNKQVVPLPEDLDIAAFDSTGKLLAVSRAGIWTVDPTTGTVRPRFMFPSQADSIALSPDATTAVARTDEGLTAFNVGDGSARWHVQHPAGDNYEEALFSGDGKCVIAISPRQHSILSAGDGSLLNTTPVERLANPPRVVAGGDVYVRGAQLRKTSGGPAFDLPFVAKQGETFQLLPAVSSSGRYVAGFSGVNPETFSVFDLARGALVFHFTLDERQSVNGAAFSADSRFLAVSSRVPSQTRDRLPSKIQVVSLAQDRWLPITPASRWTFPSKFAVLPVDARVVVVADGSMNVYDAGGTPLWHAEEKGEGAGALVVSPSGRFVARLLQGKGWVITDMTTKSNITIPGGGPLAFGPDENRVLVSSQIYRLDHKAPPQTIPNVEPFNRLWFLSGSNFVIAKQIQDGVPGKSVLFDWRTEAVSDIPEGSNFAISPDNGRFAVLQENVIGIWKIGAKNPKVRSEPLGFGGFMEGDRDDFLSFSPDGTLLAAAFPSVIYVYDANTLGVNFKVPVARGDRFAGFSLDGRYILTYRWQDGFPEPTLHPITLDGVLLETSAKVANDLTSEEWSRYGPGTVLQKTRP